MNFFHNVINVTSDLRGRIAPKKMIFFCEIYRPPEFVADVLNHPYKSLFTHLYALRAHSVLILKGNDILIGNNITTARSFSTTVYQARRNEMKRRDHASDDLEIPVGRRRYFVV